jgi:ketosteroid isomerase-like protein
MTTTTQTGTPIDHATVMALSERFNECFATLEAGEDLFTPDAFYDLLPPNWRFQIQGPATFATQLKAISEGPSTVQVLRTSPTASGFVTEHIETQTVDGKTVTARRLCLCEVRDGRIADVSVFCNGGWTEEMRAAHAAEAPMLRP